MSQQIHFHFPTQARFLTNRKALKKFLTHLAESEGRQIEEISYVFCSDAHLLDINQQYLQHDTYTDIITFDLTTTPQQLSGEIYISVDRVIDNAATYQTSKQTELLRVMFHGLLHLCGYKDKTTAQKKKMTEMEDHYLSLYLH